jgi:hypothetical protein
LGTRLKRQEGIPPLLRLRRRADAGYHRGGIRSINGYDIFLKTF